jgi:FtsP/CotA-like multicopper oxidase with cupredoxin domain
VITRAWGYNGSTPGPVLEATEGDTVRVYVTNRLREGATVHWHGVILPCGQDGVAGLTQRPIAPGETWRYDFTFRYPGTFMYHSHYDEMTQMALGAVGMIVVHPKKPASVVDFDFAIMLHEWSIRAGARRANPLAMNDFNVLTMNGKAFPLTEPLVVETGARVRVRLGNLSPMDHHPIHLHGYTFDVTATDGGPIPPSARYPETTVLVPVGATRDIELVADKPGDWAFHCHMTHHIMTQMGHAFPNTIGVDAAKIDRAVAPLVDGYMTMGHDGMGGMAEMKMPVPAGSAPMVGGPGPFSYIDMGGMFTILKVRDRGDTSPWYRHPPETLARAATRDELARDGIDVDG